METRRPHLTTDMEHQSARECSQGLFSNSGFRRALSETTYGHTSDALKHQEEETRKHREELAQIGRNVIG